MNLTAATIETASFYPLLGKICTIILKDGWPYLAPKNSTRKVTTSTQPVEGKMILRWVYTLTIKHQSKWLM